MKRNILLVFAFIAIATTGLILMKYQQNDSPLSFEASENSTITTVTIGIQTFTVEVANSEVDKAQGLSGREQLDKNAGMLFVFDPPTTPNFWMREMKFALDFIWIDENLKVIDITKDVQPPSPATPLQELPLYSPKSEIKYVLEVRAGRVENISIGDLAVIHDTNLQ